jgi:hypothetical protein
LNFDIKSSLSKLFFFHIIINKFDFHIFVCYNFLSPYGVFGCLIFVRCIYFPIFAWCSFVSGWRSTSNLVHIQSISTLVSSTLQVRRHGYFGHFNIVIFVGIHNLPFYAINIGFMSLFADLSFLFLEIRNLYYISMYSIIYMNEWIVYIL